MSLHSGKNTRLRANTPGVQLLLCHRLARWAGSENSGKGIELGPVASYFSTTPSKGLLWGNFYWTPFLCQVPSKLLLMFLPPGYPMGQWIYKWENRGAAGVSELSKVTGAVREDKSGSDLVSDCRAYGPYFFTFICFVVFCHVNVGEGSHIGQMAWIYWCPLMVRKAQLPPECSTKLQMSCCCFLIPCVLFSFHLTLFVKAFLKDIIP